jgi:branched-chain amino acid transport system permease protein
MSRALLFLSVLLAFILLPLFLENPYYLHLLILVAMNAALAMSFILIFRTGLITIAIAAFWGIGAYSSALLTMRLGIPVWVSFPLSAAISAAVAWAVGMVIVKKGGFNFVILSLVFSFIVVLLFSTFKFFGGHVGIFNIPRPEDINLPFLGPLRFTSKAPYYYLMLLFILLVILSYRAMYSSWLGRAWRAVGLSPSLAESIGIDVFKYRLLAFIVGSCTCGLMGSFFAHYYRALAPATFDPFKSLYVHLYALLGGIDSAFLGPIVGSAILILVPEGLRIAKEVEPVLTGILLVLLAIFLPGGIMGSIRAMFKRVPRPKRK